MLYSVLKSILIKTAVFWKSMEYIVNRHFLYDIDRSRHFTYDNEITALVKPVLAG